MGQLVGGIALLLLGLFMLYGFLRADVAGPAALVAVLVTVVLPMAGGAALLLGHVRRKGAVAGRKELLRQQTLEAEVLRLAGRHNGKLTIVETVGELAITPEDAKEALDALARRGLADFEVTESGVVVYAFHDVQRLSEKARAKGILE